MAFDVMRDVSSKIDAIRAAVQDDSSFGTKSNALVVLRKIGKTLLLAKDRIGYEVCKSGEICMTLEDSMFHVLESMSTEEQALMYHLVRLTCLSTSQRLTKSTRVLRKHRMGIWRSLRK
jgi:hypothetical protein